MRSLFHTSGNAHLRKTPKKCFFKLELKRYPFFWEEQKYVFNYPPPLQVVNLSCDFIREGKLKCLQGAKPPNVLSESDNQMIFGYTVDMVIF